MAGQYWYLEDVPESGRWFDKYFPRQEVPDTVITSGSRRGQDDRTESTTNLSDGQTQQSAPKEPGQQKPLPRKRRVPNSNQEPGQQNPHPKKWKGQPLRNPNSNRQGQIKRQKLENWFKLEKQELRTQEEKTKFIGKAFIDYLFVYKPQDPGAKANISVENVVMSFARDCRVPLNGDEKRCKSSFCCYLEKGVTLSEAVTVVVTSTDVVTSTEVVTSNPIEVLQEMHWTSFAVDDDREFYVG